MEESEMQPEQHLKKSLELAKNGDYEIALEELQVALKQKPMYFDAQILVEPFLHRLELSEEEKLVELKATAFDSLVRFQIYQSFVESLKPETTVLQLDAAFDPIAVYFAMVPNVKKVVIYEPYSRHYELAKKYIQGTPLKNKIDLINEAFQSASSPKESMKSGTATTFSEALEGLENVALNITSNRIPKTLLQDCDLSEIYMVQIAYDQNKDDALNMLKASKFKVVRTVRNEKEPQSGWIFAKLDGP